MSVSQLEMANYPQVFFSHIRGNFNEALFDKRIEIETSKRSMEIGSGNGHFLVEYATHHQSEQFWGVEPKMKRVAKAATKTIKHDLENIGWYQGDVRDFLKYSIPDNYFDQIWLNFPEPWPRRRHESRRLITPNFFRLLFNKTSSNAEFWLVTDDPGYVARCVDAIDVSGLWIIQNPFPFNLEHEFFPQSMFEKKWRERGKDIYYCPFRKKGTS